MRVWIWNPTLVSTFGVLAVVCGCAKAPPAAQVVLTRDPAEPLYKPTLTAKDRNQIETAFGSLAADHTPVNHPQAAGEATDGERWEDMEAAVVYACDDTEMAVVAREELFGGGDGKQSLGWEFTLRTVEDWPGTLRIHRLPIDPASTAPQRIYEASATIGRFEDHTQRADALLAALDNQLKAFGRKPRMPQ